MQITASLVKELRDKTGAGILDAKKALVENDGDVEKAMEFLRQKGIAGADKKMGRIAAEGIVDSVIDENAGSMIEVNCETDFVAKNQDFKDLVKKLAKGVLCKNPADVESFLNSHCDKCNMGIEDMIKEQIATIGEKITVRRFVRYEGNVNSYIHNGKIGVLLKTDKKNDELTKDICLHIASNAPEFISRQQIPQSVIDEETR